jgi:hypothetical protein
VGMVEGLGLHMPIGCVDWSGQRELARGARNIVSTINAQVFHTLSYPISPSHQQLKKRMAKLDYSQHPWGTWVPGLKGRTDKDVVAFWEHWRL